MGIGHHKTRRWFSCVIKKKFSETKHDSINNMLLWSKLKLYNCYCYFSTPSYFFFFIRVFFHGHWLLTGQQGKGGDHFLFHSTTSTRSWTFRHLFATLHVRWLSHIFNRTACIYQTATQWDLPPYQITIWLIDDVKLVFVCLLNNLILGLCYSNHDTENWWTWTHIDYHSCITSEPTKKVC